MGRGRGDLGSFSVRFKGDD